MSLEFRYEALYGRADMSAAAIDEFASQLGVDVPLDLRQIASFYDGGTVGGIEHYSFSPNVPSTNAVAETLRLRQAISLPHQFVVLAEPPESLLVLDTSPSADEPAVLWIDAMDARRLGRSPLLSEPDVWLTYADFFGDLLKYEEEERAE